MHTRLTISAALLPALLCLAGQPAPEPPTPAPPAEASPAEAEPMPDPSAADTVVLDPSDPELVAGAMVAAEAMDLGTLAESAVARVIPIIATQLGFEAPPAPRLLLVDDPVTFHEIVALDQLGQVAIPIEAQGLATVQADLGPIIDGISASTAFYYAPVTGTIAVSTGRLDELLALAGQAGVNGPDLVALDAVWAVSCLFNDVRYRTVINTRRARTTDDLYVRSRVAAAGLAHALEAKVAAALGGDSALDFYRSLPRPESAWQQVRTDGARFAELMLADATMPDLWRTVAKPPRDMTLNPAESARGVPDSPFRDALERVEPTLGAGDWQYRERGGPVGSGGSLTVAVGRGASTLPKQNQDALNAGLTAAYQVGWGDVSNANGRFLAICLLRYRDAATAQAALPFFGPIAETQRARMDMGLPAEQRPTAQPFAVGVHNLMLAAGAHDARGSQAASFVAWGAVGDTIVMINMLGQPNDHTLAQTLTSEVVQAIATVTAPNAGG